MNYRKSKITKLIESPENTLTLSQLSDKSARAILFQLIGWIESSNSHGMTKTSLINYILKSARSYNNDDILSMINAEVK